MRRSTASWTTHYVYYCRHYRFYIIENLCYSWIYKKKRDKYLSRVKDGLDKLQQYHIKNKIFTPLELLELEKDINIKNEIDRILQKLSIYN